MTNATEVKKQVVPEALIQRNVDFKSRTRVMKLMHRPSPLTKVKEAASQLEK
eukprot:gene1913-12913_t